MKSHNLKELSDDNLIKRYLDDSCQSAIRELVERYSGWAYRKFLGVTRQNEDDAHDLVQKLWIKVIRNMRESCREGCFRSYFWQAVNNLAIDEARRRKRNIYDSDDGNACYSAEDPFADICDQRAKETDDPESELKKTECAEQLITAIAQLPTEQREVLLLELELRLGSESDSIGWSQLAELNGISESVARNRFESACIKALETRNVFDAIQDWVKSMLKDTSTLADATDEDLVEKIRRAPSIIENEDLRIFKDWMNTHLENKDQFNWMTYSEHINVPVQKIWCKFESTRNNLMKTNHVFEGIRDQLLVAFKIDKRINNDTKVALEDKVRNAPGFIEPEERILFLLKTQLDSPVRGDTYPLSYFATLIGVPEGTIRTRIHRAKQKLNAELPAISFGGFSNE